MTLQEISSFIQNAVRYKLSTAQVILIMDNVQKIAFDEDQNIFKVWSTFTPYFTLTFKDSGYTNADATDIGKTVTDGTASGVLISYDNTAKTWIISSSVEFSDSGAVTITTGIGAGTLADSDAFVGYKGPYNAPANTRKIWGVTRETDERIFGDDGSFTSDYDFRSTYFDPSKFFENAREDNLNKQLTLINAPTVNASYRWITWRTSETITALDDNSKLLIPDTYHMQFINACILQSSIVLYQETVNPDDIRAILGAWWESLIRPYTPMGKNTKLKQLTQQSSNVII